MTKLFCGEKTLSLDVSGVPDQTLWCAMDPKSTLSFSSIGDGEAMLCVNRGLYTARGKLEPQEKKVPYDRSLCLEDNLLLSAKKLIRGELD
ncbi:MAG: hypothetical protein IJV00_04610 [Clostridia bacterium]|nr:hypothetical protein [Clostridia bacterium]